MSHIAVLSVNHQLAPVEIREQVAFAPNELKQALNNLNNIEGINSCVILSTCNRSEVYAISENKNPREALSDYLANTHNIKRDKIDPYLSYFEDDDALEHICNVATGLDSLVLGEPQILGQLKDSYHVAKEAIARAKDNKGPTFIEAICERLQGHAFGSEEEHMDQNRLLEAKNNSPVKKFRERLISENILSEEEIKKIGIWICQSQI